MRLQHSKLCRVSTLPAGIKSSQLLVAAPGCRRWRYELLRRDEKTTRSAQQLLGAGPGWFMLLVLKYAKS